MIQNIVKLIKGSLWTIIVLLFFSLSVYGQSKQPVQLKELISEMLGKHPDIKKIRERLIQADEQIAVIHSALNPKIDADASYQYKRPESKFSFDGIEANVTVSNNYNMEVDYSQTFYDFGLTRSREDLEKERKEIIHLSIEQLKQQLSLRLIDTYYNVVYTQHALVINDEEMKSLQEHLATVTKKLNAGTSTRYEQLSTEVRISKLKSRRVDIEAERNKELSVMSRLVGRTYSDADQFSDQLPDLLMSFQRDTLLNLAFQNRDELKLDRQNEQVAKTKVATIKKKMNPSVSGLASLSARNGYEPDLKEIRGGYAIGVGVHIPIYSGAENKHKVIQQQSVVSEMKNVTASEMRTVQDQLNHSLEDVRASKRKIQQEDLQVKQAGEAYRLAEVSYRAGAITNLDLLDASTSLQDSKLDLLKTNIDYLLSVYRLKWVIGTRLYE